MSLDERRRRRERNTLREVGPIDEFSVELLDHAVKNKQNEQAVESGLDDSSRRRIQQSRRQEGADRDIRVEEDTVGVHRVALPPVAFARDLPACRHVGNEFMRQLVRERDRLLLGEILVQHLGLRLDLARHLPGLRPAFVLARGPDFFVGVVGDEDGAGVAVALHNDLAAARVVDRARSEPKRFLASLAEMVTGMTIPPEMPVLAELLA